MELVKKIETSIEVDDENPSECGVFCPFVDWAEHRRVGMGDYCHLDPGCRVELRNSMRTKECLKEFGKGRKKGVEVKRER